MPKSPWDGEESGITVGDLVRQLSGIKDQNQPICFGPHGHFTFYRVKDRGGCIQIEFNEAMDIHYLLTDEHPYRKWSAENPNSR